MARTHDQADLASTPADYNKDMDGIVGSSSCGVQAQANYKGDKGCGLLVAWASCVKAAPSCCGDLTKCEGYKARLEDLRKQLVYANQSECRTIPWPQGWPSCNSGIPETQAASQSASQPASHLVDGTVPSQPTRQKKKSPTDYSLLVLTSLIDEGSPPVR